MQYTKNPLFLNKLKSFYEQVKAWRSSKKTTDLTKMPRQPTPDATEYLRRVLGIPFTRSMTGHEIQRLGFATAVLKLIIKDPATRKQMSEFIREHAKDNGMLPTVCYTILKNLKTQTIIKFDESFKVYRYNEERYKRDHKALAAFQRQVRVWCKTDSSPLP